MEALLISKSKLIEDIIKEYMPKEEGLQKTIFSGMNYAINAGGKRIRPMLMQETYKLFGGESKIIEPFMAALEMIHTYSLVHDDMPAVDNDDMRRGKPTTHIVYGETMGLLWETDFLILHLKQRQMLWIWLISIIRQKSIRIGRRISILANVPEVMACWQARLLTRNQRISLI